MARFRSLIPARAAMIVLLLCVLAVRIVVPQGFMWGTGADGSRALVLCSGSGAQAITPIAAAAVAAQHRSDQRDQDGKTADHPCAFAAASLAIDLPGDAYPIAGEPDRANAPAPLHLFARPGLGLAAPPPPKTGPPAFA
ncbi:hypothetical protein AB5I39_02050 [Sphingomonas sp. MMS24-J45]|uniref:hypothetical protein n=1 Tax=Sphingomonas sp. MMS24-J45 TaxID=3238806 RepID=UPI00384E7FFD